MKTRIIIFVALSFIAVARSLRAADPVPLERLQRFAREMWNQNEVAYSSDIVDTKTNKVRHNGITVLQKPDRFYNVALSGDEPVVERISDGREAWQWQPARNGREASAYQIALAPFANCEVPIFAPCRLFFTPSLAVLDQLYDSRCEGSHFSPPTFTHTVRKVGVQSLGGVEFQVYDIEMRSDDSGAWAPFNDPDDWPAHGDTLSRTEANLQPVTTMAFSEATGAFAWRNNTQSPTWWLVFTPAKLTHAEIEKYLAKRPPANAKIDRMPTTIARLGDRPKNFTLKDLDGHDVDLDSVVKSHRATLLFTFGAGCFGCHIDLVWAQRLFEEYRDRGLAVICVTSPTPEVTKSLFSKHTEKDGHGAVTNDRERVVGLYQHFKKQYVEGALIKADQPEYPVVIDPSWTGNTGDVRAGLNAHYMKLNNFILDSNGRVVYWSGPRLEFGGPNRAFIATLQQLGVIDRAPAAVATTR